MDSPLQFIVLLDITVLCSCITLLLKWGRLSHSHPATIYLVFHSYVFSLRLIMLHLGAPPLFSQWGFASSEVFPDPVTPSEITRAILIADGALTVMTLTWLRIASRTSSSQTQASEPERGSEDLSKTIVWAVVSVALPLGVAGLLLFSHMPGRDFAYLADMPRTAWIGITQQWVGQCLLALIYLYGFKWRYSIPLFLYLGVQFIQGFHRFRVVIPVILACQIYLDLRRRRWFSMRTVVILAAIGILYFPMKEIGTMIQSGRSLDLVLQRSLNSVGQALRGETSEALLDEYAATLTLVDEKGKWFLGRDWLYSIIILWIPRDFWPEKPNIGGYIHEISKPSRPLGDMGMIVTYLGDAYAHFRYLGLMMVALGLSWFSGRLYFRAYSRHRLSCARFGYLIFAVNLIQVYRDGLTAIVFFVVVHMMPLFLILLLHWVIYGSGLRTRGFVPPASYNLFRGRANVSPETAMRKKVGLN